MVIRPKGAEQGLAACSAPTLATELHHCEGCESAVNLSKLP